MTKHKKKQQASPKEHAPVKPQKHKQRTAVPAPLGAGEDTQTQAASPAKKAAPRRKKQEPQKPATFHGLGPDAPHAAIYGGDPALPFPPETTLKVSLEEMDEDFLEDDYSLGSAAVLDINDPGLALEELLVASLEKANRPVQMDSLLRMLHVPRRSKRTIERVLYTLQDQGRIVRIKGAWSASARLKHSQGTLQMQRSGVGYVLQEKTGLPDIFIHPSHLGDAWHGDTVKVLLLPVRKGAQPEGRIIDVLHRVRHEQAVLANRRQDAATWVCLPANPRLQAMFIVDTSGLPAPVSKDDLLLIAPGEKQALGVWFGTATTNLKREETPSAQERLGKSNHNIPFGFPQPVLDQAVSLPPDPTEADWQDRTDLRHLSFVTIDGKTARDFDDAIYVARVHEPELKARKGHGVYVPKGKNPREARYRLMVAIADVSHYVPQGTPLDLTAQLRGNSYYFPMSVEPMFPESLSNGLCSLRPDVPRLVMVSDMLYTADGHLAGAAFYPAVIKSQARLTYGQIKRALIEEQPEERATVAAVLPMLEEARHLARKMAEVRTTRGSLDFDLPEAEILINEQGEIRSIAPRERHFGHKLIEEFMIAANEAVASFLTGENRALLYRVHPRPSPEKMTGLMNFLQQANLGDALMAELVPGKKKKAPGPLSTRSLQRIMEAVAGSPQAYTINRVILRSMMQAKYTTEHEGHFGLASECYCHFTSPIRRYADLVVHRVLKHAIGCAGGMRAIPSAANLEVVANQINLTERTAVEAEREVQKRLTILYLQDKVGETYDGIISGVTDFGMFIELPVFMAEGMVRLATLEDDYYELWPERQELRGKRTGRSFAVGQTIRVLLHDVHLDRLEINLQIDMDSLPAGTKKTPGRDAGRHLQTRRERTATTHNGKSKRGTRAAKDEALRKGDKQRTDAEAPARKKRTRSATKGASPVTGSASAKAEKNAPAKRGSARTERSSRKK